MATVQITDFQGIAAEFELGHPLTMLSGPNGAGKSRIARALAAVLSDTTCPISGKKGDLRRCLTIGGPDRASVVLRAGDSFKAMIWQDGRCEPSVKGDQAQLPRASRYAAGLANLLTLTGKERAAGFAEVFKTAPTKRELLVALEAEGLGGDAADFKALFETLEINGWDAAAASFANEARKLKGAWGEVTGATWGERVAETWEPDTKQFPDPAGLEEELNVAKLRLSQFEVALEQSKAARAALPGTPDANTHACPHCGGHVAFRSGKIIKAEPVDQQQIKEVRLTIAGADGDIGFAQGKVGEAQRAVGAAQARLQDAASAREQAKARADELHQQITEQLTIGRICGPEGLRKAKLEEVLTVINRSLAALAQDVGLPLLEIGKDLEATLAGTAYDDLSRAEGWLARTIMQIVVAQCDGSTAVVIDDLDVPVAPSDRNAVLTAICQSSLQAVVLQAAWDVGDAQRTPDLAAAGYGLSYWIDHAHGLRPLAEARAGATKEAA